MLKPTCIALFVVSAGCAPANVPTFSGLERVFLLTTDDVVHVVQGDGKEVATYSVPDGTRSIAYDGSHLLALSQAGVDAIDDATGRLVQHVTALTGNHVAFASGHVAVADDESVTFADAGTFPLAAKEPIDAFVSYEGWFGFFNVPVDNPTAAIFHRFVNDADVPTGGGDGKDFGKRFPEPSAGFGDHNIAEVVVDEGVVGQHHLMVSELKTDLLGTSSSSANWYAMDLDPSLDIVAIAVNAGDKRWPYGPN